MSEINLIGGFYKSKTLPWSAQDVVNWLPVKSLSGGTRSPYKLRGAPGLRAMNETVSTGLTITGDAPDTVVGESYSYSYTIAGGVPPYTSSVISGFLPDGLTFTSPDDITGTATTEEVQSFTITTSDSSGQTATLSDTILVAAPEEIVINQHIFSRDGLSGADVDIAIPGTPAVGDAVFVFCHTAATQVSGLFPQIGMYEADNSTPIVNRPPAPSGTGVAGGTSIPTGFNVSSQGIGQRALVASDITAGTVRIILPNASAVFKSVVTVVKVRAGKYTALNSPATVTAATAFGLDAPALAYSPPGYGLSFVMHTGGATVGTFPLPLQQKQQTSPGTSGNNGNAVFVAVCCDKIVSGTSLNPPAFTLTGNPGQAAANSAHIFIRSP